jgi:hypothetical protein
MNAFRFDALLRALQDAPTTRRAIAKSLAGIALTAGLAPAATAKRNATKHRKRRTKPPVNQFGCRNVGVVCTSASQCCSGICERAPGKSKNGKKRKKSCRAHDTGGCRVEQDSCSGEFFPCTATNGADGFCHVTTGNAPYCGVSSTTFDCTKDEDCIDLCGPEAACVVCDNPDLGSFQVCIGLKEECLSP